MGRLFAWANVGLRLLHLLGNMCYIGSGAVLREGITICDNVVIGAGAVVVRDIEKPGTYVGVPAAHCLVQM